MDSLLATDPYGGEYSADLYRADVRAASIETLDAIDDAAVAQYHRDGFLAVRNALPPADVAAALESLESLLADSGNAPLQREREIDAVRKVLDPADHDPVVRALASDDRIAGAVRRLLRRPDVDVWKTQALLKPPGGGREKPWHQDNAFFNLKPGSPIMGVWLALDEATPTNGCMHVIPGSHRAGPVVHFVRRDLQICDTDVRVTEQVAVPLPPGGILFFDGLLHHGTPANRTDTTRRALQFHYITPDTVAIEPEELFAVFGSEGKDATC
jgi:phytanoyl-CoA hydroxylase